MAAPQTQSKPISEIFTAYCDQKKYHYEIKVIPNAIRVVVSNLKDRCPVDVFHTGKILIGGAQCDLKNELQEIKKRFEENPSAFITPRPPAKPSVARYDILSDELKTKLKQALLTVCPPVTLEENPDGKIEYRLRLENMGMLVTATQFRNGTLLLQGKTDSLLDQCCSEIEKIASPSGQEVVARFISSDETALDQFMKMNTPQLLTDAETAVRMKLGTRINFLSDHDQKWLIAAEALCQSKIPMPEYSPYVMPAAKAFEGFCKKLLTAIGLFPPDHFKTKTASFSNLSDKTNPSRQTICAKEKYAETFLDKVRLQLDICRNFMMHSDDATVTKVNTPIEVREKIDRIFSEIKEILDYFSKIYSL